MKTTQHFSFGASIGKNDNMGDILKNQPNDDEEGAVAMEQQPPPLPHQHEQQQQQEMVVAEVKKSKAWLKYINVEPFDMGVHELVFLKYYNFVQKATYLKPELSLLLYPLLIKITIKIIASDCDVHATDFLQHYKEYLDKRYEKLIQQFMELPPTLDALNDDLIKSFNTMKYCIRVSTLVHDVVVNYAKISKETLFEDLITQCVHFELYEDIPRTEALCALAVGYHLGEPRTEDNEQEIIYVMEIAYEEFGDNITASPDSSANNGKNNKRKNKRNKKKKNKQKEVEEKVEEKEEEKVEEKVEEKEEGLHQQQQQQEQCDSMVNQNKPPKAISYKAFDSEAVTCAAISPDSSKGAYGRASGSIVIVPLVLKYGPKKKATDDQRRNLIGHTGPVISCSFSSSGSFLVSSGADDNEIRFWSLIADECQFKFGGHKEQVLDLQFAPFGVDFASGSKDKTARVWKMSTVKPMSKFEGHLSDVTVVRFHPNGRYLATGSKDCSVRLWDVVSDNSVRLMTGHKDAVTTLCFSCGRFLISGSDDANIIVWDLTNGGMIITMIGHESRVTSLSFRYADKMLASGSLDKFVKFWNFNEIIKDYIANDLEIIFPTTTATSTSSTTTTTSTTTTSTTTTSTTTTTTTTATKDVDEKHGNKYFISKHETSSEAVLLVHITEFNEVVCVTRP